MWDFIKNNKVTSIVLGCVVFLIISYAVYKWNVRLKELAEAKTKLEQAEAEKKKQLVLSTVNNTKTETETIQKTIEVQLTAISTTKKIVLSLEQDYLNKVDEIKAIKTWDQLKTYQKSQQ